MAMEAWRNLLVLSDSDRLACPVEVLRECTRRLISEISQFARVSKLELRGREWASRSSQGGNGSPRIDMGDRGVIYEWSGRGEVGS
jgi:hypothetical protein